MGVTRCLGGEVSRPKEHGQSSVTRKGRPGGEMSTGVPFSLKHFFSRPPGQQSARRPPTVLLSPHQPRFPVPPRPLLLQTAGCPRSAAGACNGAFLVASVLSL